MKYDSSNVVWISWDRELKGRGHFTTLPPWHNSVQIYFDLHQTSLKFSSGNKNLGGGYPFRISKIGDGRGVTDKRIQDNTVFRIIKLIYLS